MTEPYSSSGHGEAQKPCRSCYKFQEWLDLQRPGTKKGKSAPKVEATSEVQAATTSIEIVDHKNCPLDKDELGRSTWGLLHTMAGVYPENPSDDDRKRIHSFMNLLGNLYPCDYCAKDLRKDLATDPPATESQNGLAQWMCRLHNRVNEKLGKPTFDCSKVNERWRDGPKDGSCG